MSLLSVGLLFLSSIGLAGLSPAAAIAGANCRTADSSHGRTDRSAANAASSAKNFPGAHEGSASRRKPNTKVRAKSSLGSSPLKPNPEAMLRRAWNTRLPSCGLPGSFQVRPLFDKPAKVKFPLLRRFLYRSPSAAQAEISRLNGGFTFSVMPEEKNGSKHPDQSGIGKSNKKQI